MTGFSFSIGGKLNEEIFRMKGWIKLLSSSVPTLERPMENNKLEHWYFPFPPDYANDWELCGELLKEIPNCLLKHRGNKWYCGSCDNDGNIKDQIVSNNPKLAICGEWITCHKEHK